MMSRNLVVCCDGTTNEVSGDGTNVLRAYRSLVRNETQICFYDSGVGTIASSGGPSSRVRRLSRWLDAAIGATVGVNVIDAYQFLVENYQDGDRIYLFGFSRGAYTVRALAGMIHFLGLLRPELHHLRELAWGIYSGEGVPGEVSRQFQGGKRFRKVFCREGPVRVHFIGVWDTVSSFGWFGDLKTVPHTANNPSIDHIRHAVAIDERRGFFRPNLFRTDEKRASKEEAGEQSFKEVWFAGSHGDVGGGYPEKDGTLSKISLEWMLHEAVSHQLLLDPDLARERLTGAKGKLPPDALGTLHNSLIGRWKLAEFVPMRRFHKATSSKVWHWPNFFRHREVKRLCVTSKRTGAADGAKEEEIVPVLHQSVIDRLNATTLPVAYRPSDLPTTYTIEPYLRPEI
ncbi:T6SS phospholipase effector Tle1-like catalytic domain-containing protein [Planctomicrobium sp. SH668]|uniref:T6SS phospholipase effector Tle1-like catalytic domain-containing protein n=1 Tax=Planctomicrobium sp. SH668 TaxID=3448126 RepID=UPI003F5B1AE2